MNNSDDFNEQFTLFNSTKFEEKKENDFEVNLISSQFKGGSKENSNNFNQNDSLANLE